MNKLDSLILEIEQAEHELDVLSDISSYNVDSKREAETLLIEDIACLKSQLQDELNKPTYYDIYGTD